MRIVLLVLGTTAAAGAMALVVMLARARAHDNASETQTAPQNGSMTQPTAVPSVAAPQPAAIAETPLPETEDELALEPMLAGKRKAQAKAAMGKDRHAPQGGLTPVPAAVEPAAPVTAKEVETVRRDQPAEPVAPPAPAPQPMPASPPVSTKPAPPPPVVAPVAPKNSNPVPVGF